MVPRKGSLVGFYSVNHEIIASYGDCFSEGGAGGLTNFYASGYVYRLYHTHFPKSGPSGPLFFSH